LENTQAIKLIDKILKNLDETGINSDALIDDIKELRGYAIEQKVPLLVKVLRYTYEHIEEHQSFLIPILDDEPLDEEDAVEKTEDASPVESLKYVIALARNLDNNGNISDLREYKALLMAY
tara:strand:- start:83 stop:445 length:363 start_codon:yes stop_codon:yes gene_type:complete